MFCLASVHSLSPLKPAGLDPPNFFFNFFKFFFKKICLEFFWGIFFGFFPVKTRRVAEQPASKYMKDTLYNNGLLLLLLRRRCASAPAATLWRPSSWKSSRRRRRRPSRTTSLAPLVLLLPPWLVQWHNHWLSSKQQPLQSDSLATATAKN
jgi:hypothetical protein